MKQPKKQQQQSTSRQMMSPIERVIHLLKRKETERIIDLFVEYPVSELDCWAVDDDGRTLLHRVMSFRPSVQVVDLIIARMVSNQTKQQSATNPEDTTDRYGMTPLHIAAASGASLDVIERLLKGTIKSAALATDTMNRLPLHWACCNPFGQTPQIPRKGFFQCGIARRDMDNMLAIVNKLVGVYPQAVWMVDGDGATPFDLAADRHADTSLLVLLDIAMRKIQTKNAARNNNTDFSNTEMDSSLEIPWEVSESNDDGADDVSSIGTGGVSNFGRRRRGTKVSGGLTDEERSRIHIYL